MLRICKHMAPPKKNHTHTHKTTKKLKTKTLQNVFCIFVCLFFVCVCVFSAPAEE